MSNIEELTYLYKEHLPKKKKKSTATNGERLNAFP